MERSTCDGTADSTNYKRAVWYKAVLHLRRENLKNFLRKLGYTQPESGECTIRFKDDTHEVLIVFYVDDFVILSPKSVESIGREKVKESIQVDSFGELKYHLGVLLNK